MRLDHAVDEAVLHRLGRAEEAIPTHVVVELVQRPAGVICVDLLELIGEHGSASATELARELPVTRQAVQKHLTSLAGAGLVAAERAGREVRYRVTPAPMSEAVAWMTEVGGEWDSRLAALQRHLGGTRRAAAPARPPRPA